jgi:proteasome lid subunit RPN8/RPN11
MKQIVIPASVLEDLLRHARDEAPRECCGLLSGHDSTVAACLALRNDSPTPERNYFAAPQDLFDAMRTIRNAGQSLLAIYHSHPSGAAHPSATDIAMAFYPELTYLVISLAPEIATRAFSIRDGVVDPVEIVVAES